MKKVLGFVLAGMFLLTLNAQAHCGKCGMGEGPKKEDAGAMVDQKIEMLTKELSLTDEQRGKVEGVLKEKLEKIRQVTDEYHKSLSALDRESKDKLSGILSAEQMAKWEGMKKDGHGKGCPDCKDGKVCEKCKKGACPDCKDGKMCKKCKLKKAKKAKEDHDHEHKE